MGELDDRLAAQIQAGLQHIRSRYGYSAGVLGPSVTAVAPPAPWDDSVLARENEPAVVPGSVTGYRWWTLKAPDWQAPPGQAERHWPHGRLQGVRDDWLPGVNIAACSPDVKLSAAPAHPAPARGCWCGFHAYWQPAYRYMASPGSGRVQVFGVIKAWGRVRLATGGFRAQKARILAVHLPFTLLPYVPARNPLEVPGSGWRDVFPGRPARKDHVVRTLADGRRLLLPEVFTQEEAQAAADHAEAWVAVAGDRLAADYGVRVFETRDALLACYPPDPVYGRRLLSGDHLAFGW